MEIIIIIQFIFNVITLGLLFSLIKFIKNLKQLETKAVELAPKIEMDPLIQEVFEYTFEKGLKCSIRPGKDNRTTLYYYDEEKRIEYSVTELYSTNEKKGSKSYDKILEELKGKIDNFIENKDIIREKIIKEQESAKA